MSTQGTSQGRRSAEERAAARAAGVDRYGRPLPRSLGVSPRQLRERLPQLTRGQARRLSVELYGSELDKRARGAAPVPELFPTPEVVSPAGAQQPA